MITSLMILAASLVFLYSSGKIIFKVIKPSFDHYGHLSIIKDIKANRHRFISRQSNILEDKNFSYPHLMHLILSFFPYSFSEKKYLRINLLTEIILFGFAGFAVMYFSHTDPLRTAAIAFLLLSTNPFGRFIWNAKVSGLSARNFGILTVYLYLFFFSSSFFLDNISLRLAGFSLLGFIIIISSQFATQFLLLFCLINIFFNNYLPVIALPISFLLFFS